MKAILLAWCAAFVVGCSADGDSARAVWGGPPIEPLDLKASLSHESVALLDELTCTIDLYVGAGAEVEFEPAIPEGFLGEVHEASPRALGEGEWRRWTLALRPTQLGTLAIPSFKATQRDGDAIVTSGALEVEVTSRLAGADPAVEAPAPPFPPRPSRWPWLAGAAALVMAALAWWAWRRRKPRAPQLVETPPPPHVKALRALSRLRQSSRATPYEIEVFYVDVSQVLRVYLEERFGLHAPERTTEEFLDEVRSGSVLTTQQGLELGEFLAQCDLVKFARAVPAEDVHAAVLSQAEEFVERTRADRQREVVA